MPSHKSAPHVGKLRSSNGDLLTKEDVNGNDMADGLDVSARIDATLKTYKSHYRFPDVVAEEFKKDCFLFAQCQNALIQHYHPDVPLFNIRQKRTTSNTLV